MKQHLPRLHCSGENRTCRLISSKKLFNFLLLFVILLISAKDQIYAQGTWTPLTNLAPDDNGGVMILLSDGTVMAKTFSGGTDGIGNVWNKLTPDIHGSYVNGSWSQTITPMHKTRLYFSSQVLKDGRVYVAGGEYGTGGSAGEVYNPLTNKWTNTPSPSGFVSDANSEILPDGRVLQALVTGTLRGTNIYNPVTNTYIAGPSCLGIHNESVWLKLPDNSILFVDRNTTSSERYIPTLNTWVKDGNVPVALYDPYGLETGAAFLLPDGRGFFLGSTGHTAYYTPSGNTTPGTWVAAPDIPNKQGAPDAAAAMMVNGKILCAVSPIPTSGNHFPSPTSYYEFNYKLNSFVRVNAPTGGLISNASCYLTNMLDLPDGNVLFCLQSSKQYYIYTPKGTPLLAGKPTIKKITKNGSTYTITGTRFNGISEGASYGDDWQMNTNYPLVRLTSGSNVYYARTFNWNRTSVKTGSAPDTAKFTLPSALPTGTYSLVVVANGISSDATTFTKTTAFENEITSNDNTEQSDLTIVAINELDIYPNPAKGQTTIHISLANTSHVNLKVFDMSGKEIKALLNSDMVQGDHSIHLNTTGLTPGMYVVSMVTPQGIRNAKLIVQ